MKALSIQQPWAYAIVHGTKRVENRTWYAKHRGRFAIHAGKTRQAGMAEAIHADSPEVSLPGMLFAPLGGVVGFADLIDCVLYENVADDQKIWAGDAWCFILANVVACRLIPAKGMLGFFDVPIVEKDAMPA